jgi:hypothetical protein
MPLFQKKKRNKTPPKGAKPKKRKIKQPSDSDEDWEQSSESEEDCDLKPPPRKVARKKKLKQFTGLFDFDISEYIDDDGGLRIVHMHRRLLDAYDIRTAGYLMAEPIIAFMTQAEDIIAARKKEKEERRVRAQRIFTQLVPSLIVLGVSAIN